MFPESWRYRLARELGANPRTVVQTGPFGAQLHAEDYVDDGFPFVLIKNIREGSVDPSDMPRISALDASRLSVYALRPGDVVFSRVGRVGSCFLVSEKEAGWIISGQLLRLRPAPDLIDGRFLLHWLMSPFVQDYIKGTSVGTTRQSINTSILGSVPVPEISLPEQRRIAAILDTLDDVIHRTEQVIAKLRKIKRGMLQTLLTRGVDENGGLRPTPDEDPHVYKDSALGLIPLSWTVQSLEEVADVNRGKFTHRPRNDPRFYGGTIPFVQTGDIAAAEGDYLVSYSQTLNRRGAQVSIEFPVGTVAITIAANIADTALLGIPMNFPDSVVGAVVRHPHSVRFIEMCVRAAKPRLEARAPQSAQKNINLQDLRPLPLALPNPEEEARIAEVYDGLSRRIADEQAVLKKTTTLKRGVLHDLLTGRVRVPLAEA